MASKKKKSHLRLPWVIILIVFLLAALLYGRNYWLEWNAGKVRYQEFGIEIPPNYFIHGIDVSHYQQTINWRAVKEMNVAGLNIDFAFIKATEGFSRSDSYFKRNWAKAKEANVIRGAYHFFISTRDGAMQAENFVKTVTLSKGDLPPVLDVEQTNGVNKTLLQQRIKDFLTTIENAYRVKPIIYTNADFYKRYLEGMFDDYPLWVAHYLHPNSPRINRKWHFWQHSESGKVNGIIGKVDFNVFYGNKSEFQEVLLK